MKESVINKLNLIAEQYHSIANQLSEEEVQKNNSLMVKLSKEYSRLGPVVKLFEEFRSLSDDKEAALTLSEDEDEELKILAKEELIDIEAQLKKLKKRLHHYSYHRILEMRIMHSWKLEQELVEMKLPFLQEIYLECMPDFANKKTGK